ncbi:GNAT family N-acetyltransferase [Kushneria phyllosphaerae]|uniref:Spermidine/spermine N(1)-acetyltransferase n=1 Tax=Kushneria phyllosphaerae TaxID=2100822 RepID=A0A2R8CN22_9GAMM|nr:GNAT family N-acetyltransferase [Kushneria phyllosphaerae]SPJ34232.1 Spermidine/spermine N(1)-acetyltransferase [Kushneria phyllosphaerae]
MTVVFKACGPEDASTVAQVGRETYRQTFGPMNDEQIIMQYLDRAFDLDVVTKELGHPQSRFWLLEVDGHVAGYLKMNWGDAQTESREEDGIEIERIYLLKTFQGRGLGRMLFDQVMAVARSSGSHFVWLGVWENNHQAIGFYTSMGFEIMGTHDFHMGEVVDTDYIMRLTL